MKFRAQEAIPGDMAAHYRKTGQIDDFVANVCREIRHEVGKRAAKDLALVRQENDPRTGAVYITCDMFAFRPEVMNRAIYLLRDAYRHRDSPLHTRHAIEELYRILVAGEE